MLSPEHYTVSRINKTWTITRKEDHQEMDQFVEVFKTVKAFMLLLEHWELDRSETDPCVSICEVLRSWKRSPGCLYAYSQVSLEVWK